jgi:sigma-B regulation protein RsbU (phosphoserine phosphatase)
MKRDLDAAADIQQDLLPKDLPDTLGANFAWHFEPCDELGGDILNVLPLNDHSVAVYLLDVSGHGVPAALLSVTLSRVLTTRDLSSSILVSQDAGTGAPTVRPSREVAEHLNRQFPMTAQRGHYFTMAYAVLDTQTRLLRYTIAGHPPPILVRRDCAPEQLEGGNFPIGMVDDAVFEDRSIELAPGDRLYLYSDGITEAVNSRNEMLQIEGLIQLIERAQASSLNEGLNKCIEELKRWCDSVPVADDISLLAIEIPAAAS